MDSVRSVALGFWIGTGSAAESEDEAGLSHLIEHMLFRGSASYESLEIDQLFDGMGAELNAGTGKETTSVYSRVLDVHLDRAFDVMADMVFAPRFDGADLDNEREIVLEELAMYEDDPQDKVFDVLGEAVFGHHPLGRAILGRSEVLQRIGAADLRAFWGGRYRPQNLVVAAAGSVDHDHLVALVREAEARLAPADVVTTELVVPSFERVVRFVEKETEQYHVCLGGPGIDRHDDRRYALRILDNVLGGTSSSRLFQEVRENRGLAYSVYSFTSMYSHAGQVGLYVGTRPDNLTEALQVVGDELRKFRGDARVTAEELERSKENVKGRVVLSLESTTARMNRLGASVLADLPLLSVDEVVEAIDAVTVDEVAQLADELYAPEALSAAGIGTSEATFTEAMAGIA